MKDEKPYVVINGKEFEVTDPDVIRGEKHTIYLAGVGELKVHRTAMRRLQR